MIDEISKEELQKLRTDYATRSLEKRSVAHSPIEQFVRWFREASEARLLEPNAMSLATTSPEGKPSCRIVLLKEVDQRGFTFFSNYESRKGRQLALNPFAAGTFFWPELERQVRIEGLVLRASSVESDAYFASRPREAQVSAWVSQQSSVISSRDELEEIHARVTKEFAERPIDRPRNWGGYTLQPHHVEFWQGRKSRLHDRIVYSFENDAWQIRRLAP